MKQNFNKSNKTDRLELTKSERVEKGPLKQNMVQIAPKRFMLRCSEAEREIMNPWDLFGFFHIQAQKQVSKKQ